MMRAGIRSRDIMTLKSFENAITVVYALGGSTNFVLHLLALAHEADVPLTIDDFNRIGDKVPLVGNLKPRECTAKLPTDLAPSPSDSAALN